MKNDLTDKQLEYLQELLRYVEEYTEMYPEQSYIVFNANIVDIINNTPDPPPIYHLKSTIYNVKGYIGLGYYKGTNREYLNKLRDLYIHLKNEFDAKQVQ